MAWYKYALSHMTPNLAPRLNELPGVTLRDRTVTAHGNAAWLVERACQQAGVRWTVAASQPDGAPLQSVADLIPNGLRDWVPAFLTPYQRDGIIATAHRDAHLWWAAGCLSGLTPVVVNRGGSARRMLLRDLVAKFNGAETRNPRTGKITRWDLSIPTYTQSVDEKTGYIVKNRIVAAVASGVKTTFHVVTAHGETIDATADHRFWTPSGWRKLGDLKVGDEIMVEEWPTKKEGADKARYREIDHMWNHPNAVRRESKRSDRPGVRKTARVPEHRLVVEAGMNGCTLPEFVGRIVLGVVDGITFLPRDTHVHHIDGNSQNNDPKNLIAMSAEEHLRQHGQESGWKHVSARAVPTKIIDIVPYGEEETYDLTMEDPHNSFVANGIVVHNSGKTAGAICWALAKPGATVLVTRAGVRRSHGREIERLTTHRAFVIESSEDAQKLDETDAMFVIVGWENLPDVLERILAWRPTNVIFDEAHKAKSHKRFRATQQADGSKRFDPMENIAQSAYRLSRACKRRLATTATPIKDRTRDLWAQLDLVHPDAWGPFYRMERASFAGRYCAARPGNFGGINTEGSSNLDELWDRVSLVTHHVPHSVTHRHLPPRRRIVTYVTPAEQVTPPGFTQAFWKKVAPNGKVAILEARLMEAAGKKRKVLLDMVEEAVSNGQKVTVFTGRREDCEKLADEVGKLGCRVYTGHGGTPARVRDGIQQQYMADQGPCVLVGTGDAWGEGVSLHDTDLALIAFLPYTPGAVVQWEGRFSRQGQKRPVLIQYLVAEGTVDEHVAEILLSKLAPVEKISQDDSIEGFADALMGSDEEEQLIGSILDKLGVT